MREGKVFYQEMYAGKIYEDEEGIHFKYDDEYLNRKDAKPVSLTLPLNSELYSGRVMIPFFDGLIPEGWLLDIAEKNWKIDPRDRMGLLLVFCEDAAGAVSIKGEK